MGLVFIEGCAFIEGIERIEFIKDEGEGAGDAAVVTEGTASDVPELFFFGDDNALPILFSSLYYCEDLNLSTRP
jgi:hypothetical protein